MIGQFFEKTFENSFIIFDSSGVLSSAGVSCLFVIHMANNSFSGGVLASCCLEIKMDWHSGSLVVLDILALTLMVCSPYLKDI